jgi:hypothetical protein
VLNFPEDAGLVSRAAQCHAGRMANLLDARCLCARCWCGTLPRPTCPVHELPGSRPSAAMLRA